MVLEMLTPPLSFLGATISSKKVVVTDSKIMGSLKRRKNPSPAFSPSVLTFE